MRGSLGVALLIAVLNSRLVRSQLALHARGSASFDIRAKILGEVRVPALLLNDPELQRRASQLFAKRDALIGQLEQTRLEIENLVDES